MRTIAGIIVSAVLLMEAAVGQTVADCKKVTSDADRLACYDKLKSAPSATSAATNIETKARSAIASLMKDPDSTRIRSSKRVGDIICGTYNAKNSMGGYGEAEMFVYIISKNHALLLNANSKDFDEASALWKANGCVYPR